jgi:hypothetical protein
VVVRAGGTSPQPRRVRPVGGIPKGKIIGIAAAIVLGVILLVVIINALVGDEAITNSPTQSRGVPPHSAVSAKPDNLFVTEEEYQQLKDSYHEAMGESNDPKFFDNSISYYAEQTELRGNNAFLMHWGPHVPPRKVIRFEKVRDGWIPREIP